MKEYMWECPTCHLISLTPEALDVHMKITPKCKGTSSKLRGWQGVALDGLPKTQKGEILWQEDVVLPA